MACEAIDYDFGTALRARARNVAASWAAVGVAVSRFAEVHAHLIGKGCEPRQHIGELVELLIVRALAHRLGELTDLLGEPCNRTRHPSGAIAFAERCLDQELKRVEVHSRER